VETAKTQIITLSRAIKEKQEEVEDKFKMMQAYHQKAWYESSMTEINSKAISFNDR